MKRIDINKQSGYLLIEIILGVALAGILISGITALISHSMNISSSATDRMHGIMQVENAGYWLSRDIQMSENLTLGDNAGFPLQLTWKDTDQNEYQVTYALTGGNIRRSMVKNEDGPSQNLIAENVDMDTSLTNLSDTAGMIVFNVSLSAEDINVSRTYKIKQRLDMNE